MKTQSEDADAADVATGGDMPTMSAGGLSQSQTACEPAEGGEGGIVNCEVSHDWRFTRDFI